MEDINKTLEILRETREEIKLITLSIQEEREKYERNMAVLESSLHDKKSILDEYSKIAISVTLGNLLQEISKLSGIESNRINVKLETNVAFEGIYDFNQMIRLSQGTRSNYYIRMTLRGFSQEEGSISFDYFTFLPFNFDEVQNDDDLLISHCSTIVKGSGDNKYTELIINKNIEDVFLNFDLRYLEIGNNNVSWYPSDMFTQALLNCIMSKNVKLRERVK